MLSAANFTCGVLVTWSVLLWDMKELFGSVVVVVVVVGGWGEVLLDVDDDSMSSSDSLDRDELEFLKRIRIKSI